MFNFSVKLPTASLLISQILNTTLFHLKKTFKANIYVGFYHLQSYVKTSIVNYWVSQKLLPMMLKLIEPWRQFLRISTLYNQCLKKVLIVKLLRNSRFLNSKHSKRQLLKFYSFFKISYFLYFIFCSLFFQLPSLRCASVAESEINEIINHATCSFAEPRITMCYNVQMARNSEEPRW